MKSAWLSAALVLSVAACSPAPKTAEKAAQKAAEPMTPAAPSKYKEVASPNALREAATAFRTDTVDVALAAKGDAYKGDQVEYMIAMKAGDTVTYEWEAAGAEDLWHEFHGHTADTVTFYRKAGGAKHQGVLTAPFDGIHGWYFENRSTRPVIVHIRLGGFYALDKKK